MSEPTTTQAPRPEASPRLSVAGMLQRATVLYLKHLPGFTGVLVIPVLIITLAGYGCIILNYLYMDFIIEKHSDWLLDQNWQVYGTSAGITLATIIPFIWGFWRYLVNFASLNINAEEAIEGRPIDFKAAFQNVRQKAKAYSLMLITYGALLLGTFFPYIGGLLAGAAAPSDAAKIMLILAGMGTTALLWLLACVIIIFLTFVFQIAAFESLPPNPFTTFKRSTILVWHRLGATLALQIILAIITSIISIALTWLLSITHITYPFDYANGWILDYLLRGQNNPLLTEYQRMALDFLTLHQGELVSGTTQAVVSTIIMGLLLPLGTFAFTLLYRDVRSMVSETPQTEGENAPEESGT